MPGKSKLLLPLSLIMTVSLTALSPNAWTVMQAQLVQADPIKGQDPETADQGRGNSGWVQAPTPRGHNAPEQAAQGAGAARGKAPGAKASQPPEGENPGTPMTRPLAGPS